MPCIMNQYPAVQTFSLSPDLSPTGLQATLQRLLVSGQVMDSRLSAYCNQLQERFALFCSTCPVPQWSKGLVITPEIRCQTELYLPIAALRTAFSYLLLRSCKYQPFFPAVPIFTALSWVDALERIDSHIFSFNPARIITAVAEDQALRAHLLTALFIPKRYGTGFNRYPLQQKFLHAWLSGRNTPEIALLDAACGSGAGVYELVEMVTEAGFYPEATIVHGCTVEPLELVAAAHGWFPDDRAHEQAVKRVITRVLQHRSPGTIKFFREDICTPAENYQQYDVVICNGLLGGPLLHEQTALDTAIKGLVRRLKKGGILLAADRFHAGWRRVTPLDQLKLFFVQHGIRLFEMPEGIGGIKI